jgi:hypothetical protein
VVLVKVLKIALNLSISQAGLSPSKDKSDSTKNGKNKIQLISVIVVYEICFRMFY